MKNTLNFKNFMGGMPPDPPRWRASRVSASYQPPYYCSSSYAPDTCNDWQAMRVYIVVQWARFFSILYKLPLSQTTVVFCIGMDKVFLHHSHTFEKCNLTSPHYSKSSSLTSAQRATPLPQQPLLTPLEPQPSTSHSKLSMRLRTVSVDPTVQTLRTGQLSKQS